MDGSLNDIEDVQCWIEKSASIFLRAAKGGSCDPVELTSEEARLIARELIELSVRLDHIDGDEVRRQDWIRIPMQYVGIHAEQDPDFDHEERFAGADIECWIKDQTRKNALLIATGWIEESGWRLKEVEQQFEISRDDFEDGDEDIVYYDQAVHDDQVFVYNVYSTDEAEQDSDAKRD